MSFFQKNKDASCNADLRFIIVQADELWRWIQKQAQVEFPDLWNEIKQQRKIIEKSKFPR